MEVWQDVDSIQQLKDEGSKRELVIRVKLQGQLNTALRVDIGKREAKVNRGALTFSK